MGLDIQAYRQLFTPQDADEGDDWRKKLQRAKQLPDPEVADDTSAVATTPPSPGQDAPQTVVRKPVMTSVASDRPAITPNNDPPEYYPNGVRKQAMDERTPSGQSMYDVAGKALRDKGDTTQSVIRAPYNPLADARQEAENQYVSAIRAPISKQAWWKDALVKAAQVANNVFNPQRPVAVEGWGTVKHNRAVGDAANKLKPLQEQYNTDVKTQNVIDDNKRNAQQFEDRQKQAKELAQQRQTGMAMGRITKMKWFDPTNPAHIAEAKAAGLDPTTLQGWDDRKRDMKQVGGIWYRDTGNGTFAPTDIPKDEAKTLVDYTVEMPPDALGKREKRTYKVSQKDAANFSTQMSSLGARLAQSDDQFNKKLTFDKEKEAALNNFKQAYLGLRQQELQLRQAGDIRGADAAAQRLATFKATLQQRVSEGKLEQGDAEDILNEITNPGGSAVIGVGPRTP